jgi:hypothetical protein
MMAYAAPPEPTGDFANREDLAPLDESGKRSKRETGVVVRGTKRHVEFVYRLANPDGPP